MSGATSRRVLAWRDPLDVAAGMAGLPARVCLLSGGAGRRSFVAAEPADLQVIERAPAPLFSALPEPGAAGMVFGLAAYDAGARAATGERSTIWPDLIVGTYRAILVFDHVARTVEAVGFGDDASRADHATDRAVSWWKAAQAAPPVDPPSQSPQPERPEDAYRDAVADVVVRIAAGELFQANIARAWRGVLKPEAEPFDVLARLVAQSPSPYTAYWDLGDRALVSNSPELFIDFDPVSRRLETRPIKGTRGRAETEADDTRARRELTDSAKDRAENLMIVDLMRNDLARVCRPGSVRTEALFKLETHPGVHHLVSTVSGIAEDGVGAADVLEAAFPPGSITGAPKHQAMKVIARHEPPRGAWCGSLFVIDADARLTASVLIRTVSFRRDGGTWSWRALAGAGIVADSDPDLELAETEIKFRALRRALTGQDTTS